MGNQSFWVSFASKMFINHRKNDLFLKNSAEREKYKESQPMSNNSTLISDKKQRYFYLAAFAADIRFKQC
jgi:hypothetical protein